MKISKAQAEANRGRVLAAASQAFRAKGFDGVAVGEIMQAAGLTHGGFYNHFPSKEALAAEAVTAAWTQMAAERGRARDLAQLLDHYLSLGARGAPGRSCPAAALAGEISRQGEGVRAAFADGLEGMIAEIEAGLPAGADRRERAAAMVAAMVGALMLSRAVPDDSPLAEELLTATRAAADRSL